MALRGEHLPIKWGRSRRRGVALREVMIACLIVGIIFLFAESELRGSRATLRGALCQSNARQVGLALFMYAADYDGKLPTSAGSFAGLVGGTRPYLRDDSRYHCPESGDSTQGRPVGFRVPLLYEGLPIAGGWPDPYVGSRIAEPASTLLLFETDMDRSVEIAPAYRHSGGAVCLALSGQAFWAANLRNHK
jgi:hypothetical protein